MSIQTFPTDATAYEHCDTKAEAYREHARDVIPVVWPGGTLELGENVELKVSGRLTSSRGNCHYKRRGGRWGDEYALIKITDRFPVCEITLHTVRHELIHAWQWIHENGKPGHGPTFTQWLEDCHVEY